MAMRSASAQGFICLVLSAGSFAGEFDSHIRNATFESRGSGQTVPAWDIAVQDGFTVELDYDTAVGGKASLRFAPGNTPKATMARLELDPSLLNSIDCPPENYSQVFGLPTVDLAASSVMVSASAGSR